MDGKKHKNMTKLSQRSEGENKRGRGKTKKKRGGKKKKRRTKDEIIPRVLIADARSASQPAIRRLELPRTRGTEALAKIGVEGEGLME